MRSVYETRRDNLRALARQWGGPTSLARKLDHANGSYLAQRIGPHPTREVSEKTARGIEQRLIRRGVRWALFVGAWSMVLGIANLLG